MKHSLEVHEPVRGETDGRRYEVTSEIRDPSGISAGGKPGGRTQLRNA